MSDIEVCEYEDLSNSDCVNCFNGFPHIGCPKEEAEKQALRELVHKRAEANKQKVYNEGYEQGRAELIKQFDESSYMIIHVNEYGEYQPCCYTLEDIAEQLKEQSND